jgi:predicted DNA-binding ArsR family transcriptional regulator
LALAKFDLGDSKTLEKSASTVASDLASTLKKLPGDALFLNEVSPEHVQGYVVYLRRVIEVNENAIVRTQARLPSDARYLRASRLRSPYVYALSQQFGAVFSAIGLPTVYESARDALITSLKIVEM